MIVLASYPIGCDQVTDACFFAGASYDPTTDTWSLLSTQGGPSYRVGYAIAWTGKELAVWGGMTTPNNHALNTGALYDPQADAWRPMSAGCGLSGRYGHTAVWDGAGVIIWGGYVIGAGQTQIKWLKTGARYDPIADSWEFTTVSGAPSDPGVEGYRALWSGTEMLVWYSGKGARYRR